MCGHVGVAGKLEYKDESTMKRLLLLDYFRGPDSTGIAAVSKTLASAKIAKIASHPLDLFDTERFKKVLSATTAGVLLGHNRAATRGVVTGHNAHPYEFDHIIGAHNGTLSASSAMALEEKLGVEYDVDSQAIFASIAKFGIKETVPLLQGAWALVWVDMNEGTLNFLRNKERPLWYAYSKALDKIFWSSEWEFIDAALKTSGAPTPYELAIEFVGDKEYRYFGFETDVHYKYDLPKLIAGVSGTIKPVIQTLKGKEPAPVVVHHGGQGVHPFHRQTPVTPTTTPTVIGSVSGVPITTSTTTLPSRLPSAVVHAPGIASDPFAGHLPEEKFNQIAQHGCDWCGCPVAYDEKGITVFEKQYVVLCPLHSTGNQVTYLITDKPIRQMGEPLNALVNVG